MTRKHTAIDRNRKRRMRRTEYRRELEKAFKADQQATAQPATESK